VADLEQTRRETGPSARMWLIGALAVLAVIFIALNSQEVKIKFIFSTTTAPLFFALLITAAIGLIVGYFVGRRSRGRD
jgi:uncharacterized integral membrane protein